MFLIKGTIKTEDHTLKTSNISYPEFKNYMVYDVKIVHLMYSFNSRKKLVFVYVCINKCQS